MMNLFATKQKSSRRPMKTGPGKRGGLWNRLDLAADRAAFSWKIREALYRHLETKTANEVPIEDALDSFAARMERGGHKAAKRIIDTVSRSMRNGSKLAASLGKWIPSDEATIISSGESAGNIAEAMARIVETNRRVTRIKRAMRKALTEPAILFLAVCAFVWSIGSQVTPALQQFLPKERASGSGRWLYDIGEFFNSYWALVPAILFVFLAGCVMYSLPRWTGPLRIKAERFLPWSFYRDIQGFAWLMSFVSLAKVGVADVVILEEQLKQPLSPWLKERVYALWWRVNNGASFGAALQAKGARGMPAFDFPSPEVVENIASLAGFSDSAERITKMAVAWAEDMEREMDDRALRWGLYMQIAIYLVILGLFGAANSLTSGIGTSMSL